MGNLLCGLGGASGWLARRLDLLQPALALGARLWVSWQFFKAGLLKLRDWETTVFLFEEEYRVPVVPPELAALLGTGGELLFPALLALGIFGRIGALGLSAVNVMAVIAYAHVLLEQGFEAALGQHYLWGFMLVTLAVYGTGRWSLDALVFRTPRPSPPGA